MIKKIVHTRVGFWRWKRTITLFSYWTRATAPEMAIGIDYFKGYTNFMHSGLTPDTYDNQLKQHSKRWANVASNMVFKGLLKEPFSLIHKWAGNLHVFGGTVRVLGDEYSDRDLYKMLYNKSFN